MNVDTNEERFVLYRIDYMRSLRQNVDVSHVRNPALQVEQAHREVSRGLHHFVPSSSSSDRVDTGKQEGAERKRKWAEKLERRLVRVAKGE